jgi:branched-chain amino acid transport system substrate-binding protein
MFPAPRGQAPAAAADAPGLPAASSRGYAAMPHPGGADDEPAAMPLPRHARLPRYRPSRQAPFAAAVALVAAVVALAGCRPAPPVRIGFVGGLTGRISDLAVDGRNGAQLAVETLDAQGGPRYELSVHDNGHAPDQGRAAIDAAADEGDAFVVGPMTSALAISLSREAERRRLVMISPTANSDLLSGRDDYFFRIIAPAGPGARLVAQALRARGVDRVAVLLEWGNRVYTEDYANAFEARWRALGGADVARVAYEDDADPDFAALAQRLLARRPGAVLLVCGAVDASIAAQQLRRLDPRVPLAIASWAANEQLLQLGGRAVEGALVQQVLDLDSRAPAWLDFLHRFRQRFGTMPGQAAVYSYEAVMVGVAALGRRAPGRSLRDVLGQPGPWPGLQGPVILDRFGDSANPARMSEVRDGRFVMLPP